MPRQSTPEQLRINAGRDAARRAVFSLALASGAALASRPARRGGPIRDVQPLDGLAAAREIEHGARHAARSYILAARQAGHSWHDIGIALDVAECGALDPEAETTADAAFTYATGTPGTRSTGRPDRVFPWQCRSCNQLVIDHGPAHSPRDSERGHDPGCPRLTPALRLSRPEPEAGQ